MCSRTSIMCKLGLMQLKQIMLVRNARWKQIQQCWKISSLNVQYVCMVVAELMNGTLKKHKRKERNEIKEKWMKAYLWPRCDQVRRTSPWPCCCRSAGPAGASSYAAGAWCPFPVDIVYHHKVNIAIYIRDTRMSKYSTLWTLANV